MFKKFRHEYLTVSQCFIIKNKLFLLETSFLETLQLIAYRLYELPYVTVVESSLSHELAQLRTAYQGNPSE